MTVIRPNSVSGINSITAQANEIKIFKSDGTQGGLVIGGANLNATSGISTVAALTVTGNVSVGGTLTYQDVTNIDSVGVVTARAGVHVTGGNVAVGHNNPSVNLHVKGSASNGQIYLGGTGAHSQIYADNDGVLILNADQGDSAANSYLGFNVDNSERLRVDSSGRLLIGRTSALASSAERLTIDDGMAIFRRNNSNAAALYIRNEDTTADTRQPYLIFTDGGGNRGGFGVQYNESSLWISGQNGIAFRTGGTAPSTTERVRILSDGKVAIGGVTANSLLDVHGGDGISITHSGDTFLQSRTTGTTGTNYLEFKDSGGAAGDISYYHNGDYMRFKTGGAERARIDSDGHLQIRREGVASMPGVDTRHTRYIVRQTNGQEAILGSVFAQGQSGWGGDLVFATKNDNGNPSSGLTERMRLDMNGKLIIKGESNAELNLRPGSSSGNDIISFENSGGTQRGNITYDTDNNFMFFNVSQSERTRIDQNGTLSHGTTTDNPGDANTNTGFAIRANGKYFFSCASDGGHINRNNAGYVLHARYGGGHKGGVYVNSTNTSFQTSSDYRLKENVVDLSGAITRIKQLTPKRFNFIVEPDTTVDGFLAHEAATVVPEAVTGTYNEVDGNGNPVYQGIDNGKLVPLLTAALQEAIAKIETLEAAVTALQGS